MGLHTSWAKTKIQNVAPGPSPLSCVISGHQVEAVNKVTYLGSDVDSSGYCTPEILRRIGLESFTMSQLDRVWRQSRLSNTTRFRIYTIRVSYHHCYMLLKHGHYWKLIQRNWRPFTWRTKREYLASSGMNLSRTWKSPPSHSCRPYMKL